MELVAAVDSAEGVSAAVQSGADAVYVSLKGRSDHKYFSETDFAHAAEFCRVRGVKIYVSIGLSPEDSDFEDAVYRARIACRRGADAVSVHDLGLVRVLRRVIPDVPIFAGPEMNIHNLEGLKIAAAMGIKRAAISCELTRDEISVLCERSPIELEILAYGSSCASYSGQCYMSSVNGGGKALDGRCSHPCLFDCMSDSKIGKPLMYKDICLASHLSELAGFGAAAVCIDGRALKPEHTAAAVGICSDILKSGRPVLQEDIGLLLGISPRGLTDGYYTGNKGVSMLSDPNKAFKPESGVFASVKKDYLKREYQHIPVLFYCDIFEGRASRFAASDDLGNIVKAEGASPYPAFHQELTSTIVQTELYKTGGTPFYCSGVKCSVGKGLSLPAEEIGKVRDSLLKELMEKRREFAPRSEYDFDIIPSAEASYESPLLTVSVSRTDQLSHELLELMPPLIYIPMEEIPGSISKLEPFLREEKISVCPVLPRVIKDGEAEDVSNQLKRLRELGISEVAVSNIGHILFARSLGFNVRGDIGLNLYNSRALATVKELGLLSAVLPFDLHEVRSVPKCIDTELIVYGRLPLMFTENCISKMSTGICSCDSFSGLLNSQGFYMPVMKSYGCRSTVLSSKKLFLADDSSFMTSGFWGVRLVFTTENAAECVRILKRFLGLNDYMPVSVMGRP